jgi:hypothetical protein
VTTPAAPRHRIVVDTETTGLTPNWHVPVEVAWWDLATGERGLFYPPVHDEELDRADPEAMEINGYRRRGIGRMPKDVLGAGLRRLHAAITGHTLAGSKPSFDADMISPLFDAAGLDPEPWHHHYLDLGSYAAGRLGLPEPLSASKVATLLGIDPGGHTAEGDVTSEGRCFLTLDRLLTTRLHNLDDVLREAGIDPATVTALPLGES